MAVEVPQWVLQNFRREQMLSTADEEHVRYWNARLREIDPNLALAFAPENAHGPGIVPGRWHVRRRNDRGPDTYWAVVTPDGGFREMDSGVLAQFVAADLWNSQVRADHDRALRQANASKERARETTNEARRDEVAINVRALENPSVLFADGVKWSNKPKGKRGRK